MNPKLHAVNKTRFVLIVKAMYFCNPFGMALTFTSNLFLLLLNECHNLLDYEILQESSK